MSDFLARLLARQAPVRPAVARRRPALFEGTEGGALVGGPLARRPRAAGPGGEDSWEEDAEAVAPGEGMGIAAPSPARRPAPPPPDDRRPPAGPGAGAPILTVGAAPPTVRGPQPPPPGPGPLRRLAPAATIAEALPRQAPQPRRVVDTGAEPGGAPAAIEPGTPPPGGPHEQRRATQHPGGLAPVPGSGPPAAELLVPAPARPATELLVHAPFAPAPMRRAARNGASVRAAPQPPPAIHVTIGRIEVRAAPPRPTPTPLAAPRPKAPKLGLDEYLRARNGKAV